ncbi:EAL domain-containing protein [Anderseniella sp. Alg231-50]|uniref:EAL domain-containing protein n=1 Tax=Anderseniella sp. Alg231-50 TaxID=1922226 RepID=UPI000D562B15
MATITALRTLDHKVVDSLQVVEPGADPALADLCRLVARTMRVSGCVVAIVDDTAAWGKASFGYEMMRVARRESLSNLIVDAGKPLLVHDATTRPHLKHYSQIASGKVVGFAGAPLNLRPGHTVGALLLVNDAPLSGDSTNIEALTDFADLAVSLLMKERANRQRRQALADRKKQAEKFEKQASILHRQTRLFDQISRITSIGTWQFSPDTSEIVWSDATRKIHGVEPDYQPQIETAIEFYSPPWRETVSNCLKNTILTEEPFDFHAEITRADGAKRWVRSLGEIAIDNEGNKQVFGTFEDVTEQHTLKSKLIAMAYTDDLTNLKNRRSFYEALENHTSTLDPDKDRYAVIAIDVDDFKNVNDRLGHTSGDALLMEIGHRLAGTIGTDGDVYRLAGDEFSAIVPVETDPETMLAEISDLFSKPFELNGTELAVSGSVGAALYPDHSQNLTTLYDFADAALLQAKSKELRAVQVFSPELRQKRLDAQALLEEVGRAVKRDEFTGFLQPIVNSTDRRIVGFEALARWKKSDDVILPPAMFWPALEDPVLSIEIGDAIIHQSISNMAAWLRKGIAVDYISVNVSTSQLSRPEFASFVQDLLSKGNISPKTLTIEITENVLLSGRNPQVRKTLGELDEMGVSLSLDDFGTGFASLSHLRTENYDVLKVDREFVMGLPEDRPSFGIVKALTEFSNSLEKKVIAEGVETIEQADLLAGLGCDCLQGYYFSKPVSVDEATRLLIAPPWLQDCQVKGLTA